MEGLAGLKQAMEQLLAQAEAQEQHQSHLQSSAAKVWPDMADGLAKTTVNLTDNAKLMGQAWQDDAGDLYSQRVREAAAKVDGWHQSMVAADVPGALGALDAAVGNTITEVRKLKKDFDELEARLLALQASFSAGVAPTQAAGMQQAMQQIIQQMVQLVEQAQAALEQLSQRFLQAAEVVRSAANGEPAQNTQGPATTSAAPSAAPTATGAGPSGAGPAAAPGGAGPAAAGGGPAAAGASPGGGPAGGGAPAVPAPTGLGAAGAEAGGPSLSGLGVPPPTLPSGTGLPTPTVPSPTPFTPGTAVPPFVPPVSNFAGSGKPFSAGGPISAPSPRIPGGPTGAGLGTVGVGGVAGTVAGAGSGRIPRAANPGSATTTPTSGQAPSTPTPPGGGGSTPAGTRGTPPPMMPPLAGGRGGAGNGKPKPGNADGDGTKHKARPPRNIPGVPARLRGRAGKLDTTPAFLSPARHAQQESEENEARRTQLLDEELWQVGDAPGIEVTNRRQGQVWP
jgi:hypothetical protein